MAPCLSRATLLPEPSCESHTSKHRERGEGRKEGRKVEVEVEVAVEVEVDEVVDHVCTSCALKKVNFTRHFTTFMVVLRGTGRGK